MLTAIEAVWKLVRSWSKKTLEKAEERVVDVQGDEEDEYEEEPIIPQSAADSREPDPN